jgi:CheY-like chemotaxis protein
MKLLIVEDNPSFRRLLRSVVAPLAEEVFECADGSEALAAYTAQGFSGADFVLMDIEMKGMDGLTATRQIRAADPMARVIIVTGFDESRLREAAQAAGACGYVLKENLLEVRRWLQSSL